jgi:hypothetical protein
MPILKFSNFRILKFSSFPVHPSTLLDPQLTHCEFRTPARTVAGKWRDSLEMPAFVRISTGTAFANGQVTDSPRTG